MKGFIDKLKLYNEITNYFCQNCKTQHTTLCENCAIWTVLKIIRTAPTEKLISLTRLAKWEICSDGYYPYCSNCKEEPQGRVMTDYCPNCGAYMKGDKNRDMTEHEQEVYDNILKENAEKTGVKMF